MRARPRPINAFPAALLLLLAAPALDAQQVTGRVTNQQTGAPLAAVQVYIAGTGVGALTQQNGRYLLLNLPVGVQTLTVERIGYRKLTQQVTVTAGATIQQDFALSEEALGLDEIVVTGTAGGGRQREVGAAVSRVGGDQLALAPVANLSAALQGQTSGLLMTQGSPQPGTAPVIMLRGVNSVSQGNEPLVYVDGVRIYGKVAAASVSGGSAQDYNPIANIRPQDIERIEVVRGPAATTLYGTEASKGVIQIFTRRGLTGAPQWTAEVSGGFARQGHVGPTTDNPEGFGFNNCSDRVTSLGERYADVTCGDDGDFLKLGPIQRYNLAVQGGTAGFTYALSGNYRSEESPFDGSKVDVDPVGYVHDGGARANFTFAITPKLSGQWSSSLNLGTTRWVPAGAGGSYQWTINMSRGPFGVIKQDGKPASALAFKLRSFDKKRQVTTGLIFEYKPSERFNHRLSIGYDYNQNNASGYGPYGFWNFPRGYYDELNWNHSTTSIDYGVSFKTSLRGGEISSTTSAGVQGYQDGDRRVRFRVEEFPAPTEVPTLIFGSSRQISDDTQLRVINAGTFIQQMFGYKDYLFVTAALRLDGNSAFGESYGLQPYPKLSASWILSDMDFWPTDWFQNFKLRAAMGEAGKAPGAFDAVRSWAPVAGDKGKPGFAPAAVGNPDLGPERTREYELGFDASLYDGRITAEVTAYHQRTYDALVPVTPIPSLGFTSAQLRNVGVVQNRGGEVSLNFGIVRRRAVTFDVGLSGSLSKSKAIDLGGAFINTVREGYPVPSYFGRKVMNPDEYAEPVYQADQFIGPTFPYKIATVQPALTLGDHVRISALAEYQGGGFVQDNTAHHMSTRNVFGPCYASQAAQRAAAQGNPEPLKQITALWRARCTIVATNQRTDNWIESTDFMKLRTVTVTYDFPDGWIPRTQSSSLTVSAGGNLWKRTDYSGTDPEARNNPATSSTGGTDYHSLPPYQTFVASLRIRF